MQGAGQYGALMPGGLHVFFSFLPCTRGLLCCAFVTVESSHEYTGRRNVDGPD